VNERPNRPQSGRGGEEKNSLQNGFESLGLGSYYMTEIRQCGARRIKGLQKAGIAVASCLSFSPVISPEHTHGQLIKTGFIIADANKPGQILITQNSCSETGFDSFLTLRSSVL
jgi:hypothetical protein